MRFAKGGLALRKFSVCLLQPFFPAFALRDVPENSLDADDAPLRIVNGRFDDVHITLLAAWRLVHFDGFKEPACLALDHV